MSSSYDIRLDTKEGLDPSRVPGNKPFPNIYYFFPSNLKVRVGFLVSNVLRND